MKHIVYGAIAVSAFCGAASAQPCTLGDLKWLKGTWTEKSDETQGEERWTIAPSGQMVGASWFLHPGRDGGLIETMTILPDKDLSGNDRIVLRIRHFNATLMRPRRKRTRRCNSWRHPANATWWCLTARARGRAST